MININKKQKTIFTFIVLGVLIFLYFVGKTYAIKTEIKNLEAEKVTCNKFVEEIELTQAELHDAAEALRQPLINDLELAGKLSEKWMALDDEKKSTNNRLDEIETRLSELNKKQIALEKQMALEKQQAEAAELAKKNSSAPAGEEKAQMFELTAYCCGTVTATGTTPTANRTIAVDPKVIPLGSRVYIEGYGTYTAEDTGGVIKGNIIDIYIPGYDNCIQFGRRKARAWIVG